MSSKTLVVDSCSNIEADRMQSDKVDNVALADCIINPQWDNLVGKVIIINLPTKANYKKLCRYNKVISRFPISECDGKLKYILEPFESVEFKLTNPTKSYDKRILNKYLMRSSSEHITTEDRFLLGTDIEVGGHLTIIGYIIQHTIKH